MTSTTFEHVPDLTTDLIPAALNETNDISQAHHLVQLCLEKCLTHLDECKDKTHFRAWVFSVLDDVLSCQLAPRPKVTFSKHNPDKAKPVVTVKQSWAA